MTPTLSEIIAAEMDEVNPIIEPEFDQFELDDYDIEMGERNE